MVFNKNSSREQGTIQDTKFIRKGPIQETIQDTNFLRNVQYRAYGPASSPK
jgi:hypothetical protein